MTYIVRVVLPMLVLALFAAAPAELLRAEAPPTLIPYTMPPPDSPAVALTTAGSPGRIDLVSMIRLPAFPHPARQSLDRFAFTTDVAGGIALTVSGALVHDRWTWRYYRPGVSPETGPLWNSCAVEILAPGDPGNPTASTALVACTGESLREYPSGCPCSTNAMSMLLNMAGTSTLSYPGLWTTVIDFRDGSSGAVTTAVIQRTFDLKLTPAVLLTHGYNASCSFLSGLESAIEVQLAIPLSYVQCFSYDSRKGVRIPAIDMAQRVRTLRQTLGLNPLQPVHLVGHSMGGLVIRMYFEEYYSVTDGPIGSLNMLGTPNNGVALTRVADYKCAVAALIPVVGGYVAGACGVVDWLDIQYEVLGFDPDSQGIDDMTPGSGVLRELNDGFVLPATPPYRVHIGHKSSELGFLLSWESDNDCLVGAKSVRKGTLFQPVASDYTDLAHGLFRFNCDSSTLLNSSAVVLNVSALIAGFPPPVGEQVAALVTADDLLGGASPLSAAIVDYVAPAQTKTHTINVPAAVANGGFALFWADSAVSPNLTMTLRRPSGQLVTTGSPGVTKEIAVTDAGEFDMLVRGFMMSAIEPGNWELAVTGTSVPDPAQGYLVALIPDSQVRLGAAVGTQSLTEGQPQLITASLFDNDVAVAPSTIVATITAPDGVATPITLRDDGLGGDETAADLVYSGSFGGTAACGAYPTKVSATAVTSEGIVNREQLLVFNVHVAGDAVRDPCNPDDDEDGLTDESELNLYLTDALDSDTDDDGLADGAEIILHLTDPLDDDTDGDGYLDGREVALAEDPLAYCPIMRADVDGDGAVSILDITKVAGFFLQNVPPAPERYDQDGDAKISVLDLSKMASYFIQPVSNCV